MKIKELDEPSSRAARASNDIVTDDLAAPSGIYKLRIGRDLVRVDQVCVDRDQCPHGHRINEAILFLFVDEPELALEPSRFIEDLWKNQKRSQRLKNALRAQGRKFGAACRTQVDVGNELSCPSLSDDSFRGVAVGH